MNKKGTKLWFNSDWDEDVAVGSGQNDVYQIDLPTNWATIFSGTGTGEGEEVVVSTQPPEPPVLRLFMEGYPWFYLNWKVLKDFFGEDYYLHNAPFNGPQIETTH